MGGFLRGSSIFVACLHIVGAILLFYNLSVKSEYFDSILLRVLIILCVKLLVAAILLLKGAIQKRPGHFLYWIIYNCVLNILWTLRSVYILFQLGSKEYAQIYSVLLFLTIGVTGYYILRDEYSILLSLSIGMTVIVWIKWTLVFLCYRDLKKKSMDNHPYSQFKTDSIPSTI